MKLTVIVAACGISALASDLLPLEKGNRWFLKNSSDVSATFTVGETISSPTHKMVRARFEDGTVSYDWILLDDASGVHLVGFTQNGTEHYFDDPSPFLPAGGEDGQTWTGPATKVTQLLSNLNFRTPAGQMRKGTEFQIDFVSGLSQKWIMVSGVGFAAGGEWDARLLLQTYNLMSPSSEGAPSVGACPKIGISSIPAINGLTSEQRESALTPVLGIGANFLSVSIGWNELEPKPGEYSLDRVRDEIALAAKHQVSTVLNIRPIDNVRDLRPSDLADRPWDDFETIRRFAAALEAVLDNLPPEVRWINIGYEVDPYFVHHPDDAAPFLRFFQYASEVARRKTGASVGMVFSFDTTRYYGDIFRIFEANLDHVAFNYYALRSTSGYSHRASDSPALDALIMRSLARNRAILIPEAGYSSRPEVGGGPDAQATYFSNLLDSLRSSNSFAAVNIWSLYDLPEDAVRETQRSYQLENLQGSAEFLSGLGLVMVDGSAKPSLANVSEQLAKSATCGI